MQLPGTRIVQRAVAVSALLAMLTCAPTMVLGATHTILMFPPTAANGGDLKNSSVVGAIASVRASLDKCDGYSVADLTDLKKDLGSESIDAYITVEGHPPGNASNQPGTAGTNAAGAPGAGGASGSTGGSTTTPTPNAAQGGTSVLQFIGLVLVAAKSHKVVYSPDPFSTSAVPTSLCGGIPNPSDIDSPDPTAKSSHHPFDAAKFFDVVPDADGDRAFADVLIYRMRQFGYDGRLSPVNFGEAHQFVDALCNSNRGILRYHVIQDNAEQKSRGSTKITTAVAGSILRCATETSLDTLAVSPNPQSHYISFGTLVSNVVGLAIALKPKISTPQLAASLPLFSDFVSSASTLPQVNQQAASAAFEAMLRNYCFPGGDVTQAALHGCVFSSVVQKKSGLLRGVL